MRIAFASYEYPVETGGGGIGTYLETTVKLLIQRGHSVVVFAGTSQTAVFWENANVLRIPAANWQMLDHKLPEYFLPEHAKQAFDVLECTDFQACGLSVKKALPALPTVVRLHTPLYMVDRMMYQPASLLSKLRFSLSGLLHFKLQTLGGRPAADNYHAEFELLELADAVSSPSHSIAQEMAALGFCTTGKTQFIPLPFEIGNEHLNDENPTTTLHKQPKIMFIGRMELRKGVIDLADAIPLVLKEFPEAKFYFIGAASLSPKPGKNMTDFLKDRLNKFTDSVVFTGRVPREIVMKYLDEGDVFVFPSHYESFGLVCCEAMAAGKAVVGSRCGGMAEIIEEGKSGLLVRPMQLAELAKAIVELLRNPGKRRLLGAAARLRVRDYLSPKRIIDMQLACYESAIQVQSRKSNVLC